MRKRERGERRETQGERELVASFTSVFPQASLFYSSDMLPSKGSSSCYQNLSHTSPSFKVQTQQLRLSNSLHSFLQIRHKSIVNLNKFGRTRQWPLSIVCEGEIKDTRIHYKSATEGWLGVSPSQPQIAPSGIAGLQSVPGEILPLLLSTPDNHYACLGITPDADQITVKNAYRRLTKQYHPDTTELPVELAAQKFVRLKEAHNILSSPEKRRLYDWQLAQVVSNSGRFIWPYEVDRSQGGTGSRPRSSSSLDKNEGPRPLGDDSIAALAFDGFALIVSLVVIIYVLYFKNK